MAERNLGTEVTFYVYDQRKLHGYFYHHQDKLYYGTHISLVHCLFDQERITIISNPLDISSKLDIAQNVLPISGGLLLTVSTLATRARTVDDYFSYQLPFVLDYPSNNIWVRYIEATIPDAGQRERFRSHLYDSLVGNNRQGSYIVLEGETAQPLFCALSVLDPIVKVAKPALYCETEANKTSLHEVRQARIVLCELANRTIRVARPVTRYNGNIQYRAILHQKDALIRAPNAIAIKTVVENIDVTCNELLQWIIKR
jgi:hypothetical protein